MDIKSISTLSLPPAGNLVAATQAKVAASTAAAATAPAAKTTVPAATAPAQVAKTEETKTENKDLSKAKTNFKKAAPYVAGAIVLAGLGVYLVKGRGKNLNKKTVNEVKEGLADAAAKAKEEVADASKTAQKGTTEAAQAKNVTETAADVSKADSKAATAEAPKPDAPSAKPEAKPAEAPKQEAPAAKTEEKPVEAADAKAPEAKPENKPADAPKQETPAAKPEAKPEEAPKTDAPAAKTETKPAEAPKQEAPANAEAKPEAKPAEASKQDAKPEANKAKQESAPVKEAKPEINLSKKETIDKIDEIQKASQEEVNRIIGENSRNGHVDLDKMRKISDDFCADAEGRGAKRYHQAANLLEQSYIREAIKTEGEAKTGLSYLYDIVMNNPKLFNYYKKMPVEEAAIRVNNLRNNELANCKVEKEITADKFFNDVVAKIVENSQKK